MLQVFTVIFAVDNHIVCPKRGAWLAKRAAVEAFAPIGMSVSSRFGMPGGQMAVKGQSCSSRSTLFNVFLQSNVVENHCPIDGLDDDQWCCRHSTHWVACLVHLSVVHHHVQVTCFLFLATIIAGLLCGELLIRLTLSTVQWLKHLPEGFNISGLCVCSTPCCACCCRAGQAASVVLC